MLEAYSINVDGGANAAIPFNNAPVAKGCTAVLVSPATINLNKCGVYVVRFDGNASVETTVQLYKDGIAQPQAQSTGTTLSFETYVQVDRNNTNCPCSSPVSIQVVNTTAATYDFAHITIYKLS